MSKDRVGVVTGAASGIGAATAFELAARNTHVLCVDIDAVLLDEVVEQIQARGGSAEALLLDVSKHEQVAETLAAAGERLGQVDAVVNCAASFRARGLDVTPEDWDHVFQVNLQGISNVVQSLVPFLKEAGGASIVNTASISAHIAQPSRWTYNATKGAIVSLTRCMAMDLASFGIRANSVSPGWIWTPEVSRAADGDRAKWEPIWGKFHMLGRLGDPEEVARVNAFLCSSDASFITGADIPVDGGYLAMGPEGMGTDSSFAGSA